MDHKTYQSETAEQWLNKKGLSFDTITSNQANKLWKKLYKENQQRRDQ